MDDIFSTLSIDQAVTKETNTTLYSTLREELSSARTDLTDQVSAVSYCYIMLTIHLCVSCGNMFSKSV